MAAVLADYLAEAMLRPWEWGEFDCILYLADWAREQTGVDPGEHYRGTYHDQRGARRIIQEEGGIISLVDRCFGPAGYRRVKEAHHGDIGLVPVFYKRWRERQINVPMGAICSNSRMWVVRPADAGKLIAHEFKPIAVWSAR